MSIDYFIFDDFDSRNYNMYLHDKSNGRSRVFSAPRINVTDSVIGTSGEMLFDQYYGARELPLEVFVENNLLDETDFRNMTTYLASLGQKKLILSYENYKYHMATFDNAITATQYSSGLIFDTLNFKALSPFGFSNFTTYDIAVGNINYDEGYIYDSGLLYSEDMPSYIYSSIVSGSGVTIYHGGNCNFAYPVFRFTGQATTLKVEKYSDVAMTDKISEFSYGTFNGTLDVDCTQRNIFKNGVMSNNTFSGEFMNLNGITTPQFYNRGVFYGVLNSTVTLSPTAHATNDYYNGMVIYSLNKNNCIMERRVITDYDGATKVATLDSPFATASIDDSYAIYNLKDGMNYFKITGTGFVNLGLTVDFRYTYL